MRARSHKKKRKPEAKLDERKKGAAVVMSPLQSKERDTRLLTKLIETGISDQKTVGLSRLIQKAAPEKELATKPKAPELKQSVQQKEGSEEKEEPENKVQSPEENEKEEE